MQSIPKMQVLPEFPLNFHNLYNALKKLQLAYLSATTLNPIPHPGDCHIEYLMQLIYFKVSYMHINFIRPQNIFILLI